MRECDEEVGVTFTPKSCDVIYGQPIVSFPACSLASVQNYQSHDMGRIFKCLC